MIYADSVFQHASFIEATIICILLMTRRSNQAYILSVLFTVAITAYIVTLYTNRSLAPIINSTFIFALAITSLAKIVLISINRLNLGYGFKIAIGAVVSFMLNSGLVSYAAYNGSLTSLTSAIIQAATTLPVAWWLITSSRIHKIDNNGFIFNRKRFDD